MASAEELASHLSEHLRYEVQMLRYTHSVLHHLSTLERSDIQLAWNTHFEAFWVHARALKEFLSNDQDPRNRSAKDYSSFAVKKTATVAGSFNKVHTQVLHLGKARMKDPSTKINLADVDRVYAWIEANWGAFVASLPPQFSDAVG